ncbi:S49 family peptidase [Bradyrhizobium cenepequi]
MALIASVLEGRIGIDAADLKEIEADDHLRDGPSASRFTGDAERMDPNNPRSQIKYKISNGVAVVPVLGSLVNRGAWIGANSGMTSYEGLAFQISDAASNPKVKSILLDMDSPGGEAVGAFEIADKVRTAAKSKDVVAFVNGMAASAAYAIASAATRIVSVPSGVSGSIGVVLMHADYSNALYKEGIKPTLIHAGAHKVDGNPYEPLSESVKADLKAEVDQFYSLFVSSVAQGRKGRMTEKSIRGTEARTYIGQAAVDAGLVDAIGSFESVLADLSKSGTARNSNLKRMSMSEEKTFLQADLDAAVNAAVTSAKTEAETVAKAVAATHEAALAEARAEGAKAERERISGIVSSEEAKGRSATALHFAMNTEMSADAAKAALASVPKAAAAVPGANGLYLEPGASPNPTGPKGDHGWGEIVEHMNKQLVR